tara:strand:+ start:348 stop:539 length:192 start_codon:yes stop_codon:yes gene_type:complete
MSKKHFIVLAQILREHHRKDFGTPTQCRHTLELTRAVADLCKESNSRFDWDRFVEEVTEGLVT